MMKIGDMSRAELGAFVQEHLRNNGIDMVLSGGACVSIYSQGKYVSMDLDMIHTSLLKPKRQRIREAMAELGFIEERRYFKHNDTDLFIEFPPGPPAVGEEPVKEVHERKEATGTLKMLSPTDCVKDRLVYLYHNNDYQSLDQAIMVAEKNKIDMKEVERWSKGEGMFEQFRQIRKKLENRA